MDAQAGPAPAPEASTAPEETPLPNPTPRAGIAEPTDEANTVALAPTRVFIHHRAGSHNAVHAIQLAAYLQGRGFAVSDIRAVDRQIEQPSVRYFFERDQADSRRLVEAIAAFFEAEPDQAPDDAADFSHFSPRPRQGNLEVWLTEPRRGQAS